MGAHGLRVASLLCGSGYGGLSIALCARALIDGVPELPAAQAEAQDVARMFGAHGYQVRELLRPQAQRVLVHLFDERG